MNHLTLPKELNSCFMSWFSITIYSHFVLMVSKLKTYTLERLYIGCLRNSVILRTQTRGAERRA